jgi:hypothetical protein
MALLACILFVLAFMALVYLCNITYRAANEVANGVVGGVRLFWRLVLFVCECTGGLILALWSASRWTGRRLVALGLWMSQRGYTTFYGNLLYRMPRAFLARQIRELRHIRRHRARS